MKNLIYLLLVTLLSLSVISCETYSQEIYDDEVIAYNNVSLIITQGTPVYYKGNLHYYIYNGLYWYPIQYQNSWYFRAYTKIYPWGYNFNFRPHCSDYRFNPNSYRFNKHRYTYNNYRRKNYTIDNGRRPNKSTSPSIRR